MRKAQDKFQPWYTENEIRHFLKRNKYSVQIADELTPLWTKILNAAYRKGLEHGQRNYNPGNVPQKQGEKLPMHDVVQRSELFTCKFEGGKKACSYKSKNYLECVMLRKCDFASE